MQNAVLSEAIRKLDTGHQILQAKVNITQKGILGSMIILIEEKRESSKSRKKSSNILNKQKYAWSVRAYLIVPFSINKLDELFRECFRSRNAVCGLMSLKLHQ